MPMSDSAAVRLEFLTHDAMVDQAEGNRIGRTTHHKFFESLPPDFEGVDRC